MGASALCVEHPRQQPGYVVESKSKVRTNSFEKWGPIQKW